MVSIKGGQTALAKGFCIFKNDICFGPLKMLRFMLGLMGAM